MSEALVAEGAACPNCGRPRESKYCGACGQRDAPLNPTLRYFLHELLHEVLHFDGKIFRSVRLLVTRPGFLTEEIFAGRRASYVSPIRLYLVFAILAFAVGVTVEPDVQLEPASPGEVADPQVQEAVIQATNVAINVWLPRAMFVLVAVLAALVMLVRRRSDLNYPQHLYFAFHVQALWFFLQSINALADPLLGDVPYAVQFLQVVTLLYGVFYFVAAFHHVYGTTLWGTLWRTVLVGVLYFGATVLVMTAMWLLSTIEVLGSGS